MQIKSEGLGKRFNKNWLFRNLNYSFDNNYYAITGPNGSGKSTLLQILASITPSSEGKISYRNNEGIIKSEELYKHTSFAAPYLELIEEFTLIELLNFHFSFKKAKHGLTVSDLIAKWELQKAADREIRYYSSGMKQRVKLGLALYTESSFLFLDEPTVNLDTKGIEWYRSEMSNLGNSQLVLICSNQTYEYDFCKSILNILDYH